MAATSYIRNVAIVGVAGTIGSQITKALLATGKHKVTAITREGSSNEAPSGVEVKRIQYDNHTSIVDALRGQDILLISLNPTAPRDTQSKLISAAKDAGLQWVMPNEWGFASNNPENPFAKDTLLGTGIAKTRQYIKSLGLNFFGLTCGFWYEFSLGGGEARYGFDFEKKHLTLFDDGDVKIHTSALPYCGTAVAKLLSLPVEGDDKTLSLSKFKNDSLYISSFFVSQNDMLDAVLRVTGDKKSDWTIVSVSSKERFQDAVKQMDSGDMSGFVKRLYTRVFFPDGAAHFTDKLHDDVLGLPKYDFDEWTKAAVDIALSGGPKY